MADALGRAVFGVKGGGPLGQLPQFAAQLLEFQDALVEVGGVALEQVGDVGAGGLALVAEGDDLADLAQGEADRLGGAKLIETDDAPQASISDVHYNNRLILDAARESGLPMPLLTVCGDLFAATEAFGHGRADMVMVIDAIAAGSCQSLSQGASSPILE